MYLIVKVDNVKSYQNAATKASFGCKQSENSYRTSGKTLLHQSFQLIGGKLDLRS